MSSLSNNGEAATALNGDVLLPSSSPRASTSLQAAATLNAGLQRGESVRTSPGNPVVTRHRQPSAPGQRRSQVLMNLQLADPQLAGPGEMISEPHSAISSYRTGSPQPISSSASVMSVGDPHHNRAPSLGELHQELENEQEFHVNRLLQEIHRLQLQVQQQQQQQQQQPGQSTAASDDESSKRPAPLHITTAISSGPSSALSTGPQQTGSSTPRSPSFGLAHPRSSFDMARADLQRRSRTPSRGASPRVRATSTSGDSNEQWVLNSRDESAFYQAETGMLIRENQMLRHRIRDLEKQLSELTSTGGNPSLTHEPSHSSHLNRSTSFSDEEAPRSGTTAPLPAATDTSKD